MGNGHFEPCKVIHELFGFHLPDSAMWIPDSISIEIPGREFLDPGFFKNIRFWIPPSRFRIPNN